MSKDSKSFKQQNDNDVPHRTVSTSDSLTTMKIVTPSNVNNLTNIDCCNVSVAASTSSSCCTNQTQGYKTPSKVLRSTTNTSGDPDLKKTPYSSGGKRSGSKPKTPGGDDRFIPNRSATKFDFGHYIITTDNEDPSQLSPSQVEKERIMKNNLDGRLLEDNILSYKAKDDRQGSNSSITRTPTSKTPQSKKSRIIPHTSERILDAPDIRDDYYLNLLDWSSTNLLAVCLNQSLYLWNAATGKVNQLVQLDSSHQYFGAVSFVPEGNYLALGVSNGDVQIWDVCHEKVLRTMSHHSSRVASLSWNSHVITSGSRSGQINHYDVRCQQYFLSSIEAHQQEVCGLRWSLDGKLLASGGNDNLLKLWACSASGRQSLSTPLYAFPQHKAAVKALAWCPWQSGMLASGGGTADAHIRLWNTHTGLQVNSIDTQSQVCSLLWSASHKELVSSHGYEHNQIVLWKYPNMTKITELKGHTERVLDTALSPDGMTLVSASADETLRLWKCFTTDSSKKSASKSHRRDISGTFRSCIR